MKLLYINVIEQHEGWGAEYFVNRGLTDLGHETFCIDYRKYRHHLCSKVLAVPPAEAVLLQRGDGFPISILRQFRIPLFFWASELISRCRDQDRLLTSGLFKHIFFHSEACLKTALDRGWVVPGEGSVLCNGFDPQVHYRHENVKRDIDVLFIGAVTRRRRRILNDLQKHVTVAVKSAFGSELVDLFNRAKIVLNIHAEDVLDTETRIFEATGCGAFVLSEALSDDNPFPPGMITEVDSVEKLPELIEYYLTHPDKREQIADECHQEALRHHTYKARAGQIVDTIVPYLDGEPSVSGNWKPFNKSWSLYRCYEKLLQSTDRIWGRSVKP